MFSNDASVTRCRHTARLGVCSSAEASWCHARVAADTCRARRTCVRRRRPTRSGASTTRGSFDLAIGRTCYPLTITDQFSRFVLACEGMAAISDDAAREVCEEVFLHWGLPAAIRSDNGPPFASTGLGGLTRLSAYLLRLGIELERIRPAHPEENGRHERMHRTLKAETTRPARANLLQQQERFDDWTHEFNHERPHEALAMKRPAELHAVSARPMPATLPELDYPTHDDTVRVSASGQIYIPGRGTVHVTHALAGQHVGIREEEDGRWLVTFAAVDLGSSNTPAPSPPSNPRPLKSH
jgi:transposase InsO family protein